MFIPLPQSIENLLNAEHKNSNYCLVFNKWVKIDGTFDNPEGLGNEKIKEFVRLKEEYRNIESQLQACVVKQKGRINGILHRLQQKGFFVALLTCKVSDALVCGIGDEHPLENSLRFDHCTGLPYIPTSSIKGVAKSAAKSVENVDEMVRNIIFGAQSQMGKIQFWDGFPTKVPKLKIDIMNNHFPEYYSNNKGTIAPSDDMNPNPVPFIVVDSDSEFYFPIVASDQDALHIAVESLKKALEEWGIGAKTSVGYGMFYDFKEESIDPPPSKPKAISQRDKALEAFRKTVSPDNFDKFLSELKSEDEQWLANSGIFDIPNFNIGFAEKVLENTTLPSNIRKKLAQLFIDKKINLKEARKRAEKKNDKKDLDRYEKLKAIVDAND